MIVSYHGKTPQISPQAYLAENATAMGDVTLEAGAALWYGAVVRAENENIYIGEGSNLQDNVVAHVAAGFPLHVGKHVTVGHGAILHGCTIEDGCLIGMGAILLNGCVIGAGSMVAAGALVTQGKIIPPGSMVMGHPAKVVRPLTQEERDGLIPTALHYAQRAREVFPAAGEDAC